MSFARATNYLGASVEPQLGKQNIPLMVEPKCAYSWIIANRCGNIIQKCMYHGITLL